MKAIIGFSLITLGLLAMTADTLGQGTRCEVRGGKIVAADWDHCTEIRADSVHMWYTYDANKIDACVEGATNGWVGVGFGGNGADYVIGWSTNGNDQVVGDYAGHTNTVRDATQDHTALGGLPVGEANGYTTFCFTRALNTGDAKDTPINPAEWLNFPWALKNGDPGNANNLDNEEHGGRGTGSAKLDEPDAVRPSSNNNDDEEGGAGGDNTVVYILGACAGLLVVSGVGYMVKQNNAQVDAYGGGSAGYGHGGYGSSGGSSGGRSHKSHRSGRSRSRSRSSKSSKRSRGGSSGHRSQASHRSRSKGSRH